MNLLRSHIQHLDHNSFVGLEDLRNLSISRLGLARILIMNCHDFDHFDFQVSFLENSGVWHL